MGLVKGTLFFQQASDIDKNQWGWTESFYYTGTDPFACLLDLAALRDRRYVMCPAEVEIPFARASTTGPPRNSVVASYDAQPSKKALTTNDAIPFADIANTALNMRLGASDTVFRSYLIRGLPDVVVTQGGDYVPSYMPAFNQALANYLTYLCKQQKWGIPVNGSQDTYQILGYTLDPVLRMYNVTLATAPTFPVGTHFKIYSGAGGSALRGTHRALTVTAGPNPPFGVAFHSTKLSTQYIGGMVLQPILNPTVKVFDSNLTVRMGVTHRISGRPSFGPRGRRHRAA